MAIDGGDNEVMYKMQCLSGFSCVADDNGAATMTIMRVLLRHFKHISSVWCSVLPTHIYLRSVGELLSVVQSVNKYILSRCHNIL